jgi:hypothetical protein
MLVLGAVGFALWQTQRKAFSAEPLLAWLNEQHRDRALVFKDATLTAEPQSDGYVVKFASVGVLRASLYARADAGEFLRNELELQLPSPATLRRAAQLAEDAALRARAGVSDTPPADPLEAIILREATAAGSMFPYAGVVSAQRVAGRWRFSPLQGDFTVEPPAGKTRETFGAATYTVNAPADREALGKIAAAQADYVARLEQARADQLADLKRDREAHLAALRALITPESLFIGQATPLAGGIEATEVSLEITAAGPDEREVSAALRNTRGWKTSRPLGGAWKFDDETGIFTLKLTTRSNQAVRDGGPLLDDKKNRTLELTLADDGKLAGESDTHAFMLERANEARGAELKTMLLARDHTNSDAAATTGEARPGKTNDASEAGRAARNAGEAAFPIINGVFAKVDGAWQPLPRNGGKASLGLLGRAKGFFSRDKDDDKPLTLIFKGKDPAPAVSGEKLILVFKGRIPGRAKGVPADYPVLEASPTLRLEDGTRSAPLVKLTPTIAGFGAERLRASVEQPASDVLTLTFAETLPPGTYALLVGTDGYEFSVQ